MITVPIPDLEASHSTMKLFEKPDKARTGAQEIAIFNLEKDILAASSKMKVSFFSSIVNGASIFP